MKRLTTLAMVSLLTVSLTACFNIDTGRGWGKQTEKRKTLSDFREQYNVGAKFEIDPEVHRIAEDEAVEVETVADISWQDIEKPEGQDTWYPVRFYVDLGLTTELIVQPNFEIEDKLRYLPYIGTDIYDLKDPESFQAPGPTGKTVTSSGRWSMLDQFYVVRYNDLKTGKLLEKPIVSTYKVTRPKGANLKAPTVSMSFNILGGLVLDWPKVPGATEYWLVKFQVSVFENDKQQAESDPKAAFTSATVLAKTKDNKWDSSIERTKVSTILYDLSDHDAVNEDDYYRAETNQDKQSLEIQKKIARAKDESFLTVVAVNGDKTSSLSNPIMLRDYADKLVYKEATFTWEKDVKHAEDGRMRFDELEDLPKELPFTMASGKTKYMPVMPLVEASKVGENGWLEVAVQMREAGVEGVFKVKNYPDDWQEFLRERAEQVKRRRVGGGNEITSTQGDEETRSEDKSTDDATKPADESTDKDTDENEPAEEKSVEDLFGDKVFATTPLSRRIAQGLLLNEEQISIRGLPGASDPEMVRAAVREALQQTPHAGSVNRFTFWLNDMVNLEYVEKNKKKRVEKAQQARETLRQALKDMQLDGLDDIEKLRRIHVWVIEHTEYNFKALEVLRDNEPVTAELEGNWTTFGPAIEHEAVCEGYSEAFVFLAREAGFEAIGITGSINGDASVGHKWSAVKLNGEWRYFDQTWDDGEGIEIGTYFNRGLNDPVMTEYHNPDRTYVIPTFIDQYR